MSETTWKKEPAIDGKHGGCLNCGPRPSFFPPDGIIAVGFGYAGVHRDGVAVYTEPQIDDEDAQDMTGASCCKARCLAASTSVMRSANGR